MVKALLLMLELVAMLTEKYASVQKYLVSNAQLYQNFFEMEELKKTLAGDNVSYSKALVVTCNGSCY